MNENKKEAKVTVPADQLSLAIGKQGQNVRLAAKLTGWKIDVITTEAKEEKKESEEKKPEEEKPKRQKKPQRRKLRKRRKKQRKIK